ncbi:uncharacterized protein cd8b [Dunckerocampus dactyliophorus]|uniref:uncharacterized protein cd8b n=1 Tax=Dunckerocampus dactyliophorus TaxID=161453 RepID=UPI002404B7B7|nr:uncharacterized protein cd8b [Dunckerocampus dactyliophorus]
MRTLAPEAILLAWILLMAYLWTSGSGQILQHKEAEFLYPELHSTQIIQCDCVNISCGAIFWFRTLLSNNKVQFLGRINSANRDFYGDDVEITRFKLSKKNNEAFTLQIINVTKDDAGSYSCILTNRRGQELWMPGVFFLPGVTLPTPEAKSDSPPSPDCSCTFQGVCDSLILWSLAGLTGVMMLALIFTLYYFSRLPKKCRHHLVKRR